MTNLTLKTSQYLHWQLFQADSPGFHTRTENMPRTNKVQDISHPQSI